MGEKIVGEDLTCQDCSKKFPRLSRFGRAPLRCRECSDKIYHERARILSRKKTEKRKARLGDRADACDMCGAPIERVHNRRYCTECRRAMDNKRSAERRKIKVAREKALRELEKPVEPPKKGSPEEMKIFYKLAELKKFRQRVHFEALEAKKNFSKVVKAAKEAGMSWGQYQAMLRRQVMKEAEKNEHNSYSV